MVIIGTLARICVTNNRSDHDEKGHDRSEKDGVVSGEHLAGKLRSP